MPITIAPISRRNFLAGGVAASAGLLLGGRVWGVETEIDPNRIALISDPHIAADAKLVSRGAVMAENLRRVVTEIIAARPRPAAVIVNGDCAYNAGLPKDYALFLELMQPLREAGIPIHITLGNHDHRVNLLAAIPEKVAATGFAEPPVIDRRVTVVKTPRAQWILLDTLSETNHTPGVAGEKQLKWLADTLDATSDGNTIVVSHHQPDESAKPSGLVDTKALLDIILTRHQVKAHLFGHTHDWHSKIHDDENGQLHQINLPPTAYVFKPGKPNGWVDCHIGEIDAVFELRCLDTTHAQHGEKVIAKWRCSC